ncbi:MAG: hypothetical protein ACPGC5_07630 [Flavobacteriaceae bacterium]
MLITTLIGFLILGHNPQIALFELRTVENYLQLQIRLESDDLKSLWNKNSDVPDLEIALIDYIQKNTEWYLNEEHYEICNYRVQLVKGHYLLTGNIYNPPNRIEKIRHYNTILVKEIQNHKNIIHILLHDRLRSFKMDQERKHILAKYTFPASLN